MNISTPYVSASARRGISCLTHGLAAALCLTTLLGAAPAQAIIGGSGVDANAAGSEWSSVGSILTGTGTFTGTLIAPGYVLTAAHVVNGLDSSSVVFQLNDGTTVQLGVSSIYINPGYTGTASSDGTVHNDLAILKLSSDAPSDIPIYSLYGDALATGSTLDLVGYGWGGTGASGATTAPAPDVKRAGVNHADQFLSGSLGRESYLFDFDGPDCSTNLFGACTAANRSLGSALEATLGTGDSGSPGFIIGADGTPQLAVVDTFVFSVTGGAAAGSFGSGGGGIIVAPYIPWIDSIMAAPVPEPRSASLMVPGLLGLLLFLGAGTRSRRKNA